MGTGYIDVVVGGQFGSEAKGHVAAALAKRYEYEARSYRNAFVRVAGPNAGHTAYDAQGRPWALRQIPVAAVVALTTSVVIGAGSEIDPEVLEDEITRLEKAGIPIRNRLTIDSQATILTPDHIAQERGMRAAIGSTAKGIGACRADRIMRQAVLAKDYFRGDDPIFGGLVGDTVGMLDMFLRDGGRVMVEGTQGYGLGLHAGFYPHCTSSDCRAIDFIAMAGVDPFQHQVNPWVVFRTYPIRVAGNSGPLRHEMTWEDMGKVTGGYVTEPELTTVTKLPRRIGAWDPNLAGNAIRDNGGKLARPVITFLDYIDPKMAGETDFDKLSSKALRWVSNTAEYDLRTKVWGVATGPDSFIWHPHHKDVN